MRLADAHAHLFADGFVGRYGRSPSGGDELLVYEGYRRAHGIERALVIGYEGERRYAGNNAYLADLAGHLDWLVPLAYAAPGEPPSTKELHQQQRQRFRGIALYLRTTEDTSAVANWPAATTHELNYARSLVSVNAAPDVLAALDSFATAVPDCAVLISHLGRPGSCAHAPSANEARRQLAPLLRLAALPNVGVKLSGLYAISDPAHDYPHAAAEPYITAVLDRFGTERVYWGSDFPPCLDAISFAQAVDIPVVRDLSPGEKEQVLGRNLLRLIDHTEPPV